jgi:hypothetical protein
MFTRGLYEAGAVLGFRQQHPHSSHGRVPGLTWKVIGSSGEEESVADTAPLAAAYMSSKSVGLRSFANRTSVAPVNLPLSHATKFCVFCCP